MQRAVDTKAQNQREAERNLAHSLEGLKENQEKVGCSAGVRQRETRLERRQGPAVPVVWGLSKESDLCFLL